MSDGRNIQLLRTLLGYRSELKQEITFSRASFPISRCGKVDIETLQRLTTRPHWNHAILARFPDPRAVCS